MKDIHDEISGVSIMPHAIKAVSSLFWLELMMKPGIINPIFAKEVK